MALPKLRADGTLPPGQFHVTSLDEIRAAFPADTERRKALEPALSQLVEVVRQKHLGSELVIDGSYTTRKPEPADIDLALLSTGASESETLRRLEAERVDLDALDLFVLTTRQSFELWVQFFSIDRLQQTRGIVILTI